MKTLYYPSAEAAMNAICRKAAGSGASDIHIEPGPEGVRVRFRRDGALQEEGWLPLAMAEKLAVRCKVMGRMNVAETRLPQDGSAALTAGGVTYDLRLSVLPSLYGETIVIRLLSGRLPFIEENALGMLPVQEETFLRCLRRQSGMILTTGPTGSGKTSTLYAALKLVNQPEVSILSIEDPVEYRIPGITQIMVNDRSGLTFAAGLRATVRQDPDIIMVGEIRDRETAEIAVHAALTGHLVLSSIHTNDAASTPLRLSDMGIPAYLMAASLSLIISQRLVRRLCPACGGAGCSACGDGFAGRTGIFELLEITRPVREAIRQMAPAERFHEEMRRQGQPLLGEAARAAWEEKRITEADAAWLAGTGGAK